MKCVGVLTLTIAACLIAFMGGGCDRTPVAATQAAQGAVRIVSLSPAISRTLVDLGLSNRVVGRTPYCTSLDHSIPVAGDLQNIDYEVLVRLNPSHILVQPPAGGVDQHLQDVATREGWTIADWRLNGVEDIRRMLRELPSRLFAADSMEGEETAKRSEVWLASLDAALAPPESKIHVRRVLMVNAVNPVMAFGAGTYLDDVLRALGSENVVLDLGWVQLSMEDVVRLAPEAIILVKPGGEANDIVSDLGPLATIDVPATASGRRATLTHADAFLPSSGVVGVAEQMRAILMRFAEIAPAADNRP